MLLFRSEMINFSSAETLVTIIEDLKYARNAILGDFQSKK